MAFLSALRRRPDAVVDQDRFPWTLPLVRDLETLEFTSSYESPTGFLDDRKRTKIAERRRDESAFELPSDFDERLKNYHDEIAPLRIVFRRGIGWRLATSGALHLLPSWNNAAGVADVTASKSCRGI